MRWRMAVWVCSFLGRKVSAGMQLRMYLMVRRALPSSRWSWAWGSAVMSGWLWGGSAWWIYDLRFWIYDLRILGCGGAEAAVCAVGGGEVVYLGEGGGEVGAEDELAYYVAGEVAGEVF